MWVAEDRPRVTGQAGVMLEKVFRSFKENGEVAGVLVSSPLQPGDNQGVCQWCALEATTLVTMEIDRKITFPAFTRQAVMTISLPACTSCYTNLMTSLKLPAL